MAKRNYKKEYKASRRSDRRLDNIARKRARRAWEKKHGKIAKGKELDHKRPLKGGGSRTSTKNLQILTRRANRKKQPKRKK